MLAYTMHKIGLVPINACYSVTKVLRFRSESAVQSNAKIFLEMDTIGSLWISLRPKTDIVALKIHRMPQTTSLER